MSKWNAGIIEEFRANAGVVGGVFEGKPILILHNTGAKSGAARLNPLMYQDMGDGRFAIFASKGGAPGHPDWYFNVVANPDVAIEVGTQRHDLRARVVEPDERDAIWEPWKARFDQFAEYEQKTDRQIPVILLEPRT